MVRIIKLDPQKNPELVKEIDGLVSDLFKTFFDDDFFKPMFGLKEEAPKEAPKVKEEPKARFDWITLGDLVDNWCKNNKAKTCETSCACTQKKVVEPDYSDVKTLEHIV